MELKNFTTAKKTLALVQNAERTPSLSAGKPDRTSASPVADPITPDIAI